MSDSNLCDNELSAGFSLLEGMGGVPPTSQKFAHLPTPHVEKLPQVDSPSHQIFISPPPPPKVNSPSH